MKKAALKRWFLLLCFSLIGMVVTPLGQANDAITLNIVKFDTLKHPEIDVSTTVKDPTGRTVPGLKSEWFTLKEKDKTVNRLSLLPRDEGKDMLSVVFVVDAPQNMQADMGRAKKMIQHYVDHGLVYPKDYAALIVVQQTKRILLQPQQDEPAGNRSSAIQQKLALLTHADTNDKVQNDGLFEALALLNNLPEGGHKSILYFSNGGQDALSATQMSDVINRAQRQKVTVHTLGFQFNPLTKNHDSLDLLSKLTKGIYVPLLDPQKDKDLVLALYAQDAQTLFQPYVFHYSSPFGPEKDKRQVELSLLTRSGNDEKGRIIATNGYFTPKSPPGIPDWVWVVSAFGVGFCIFVFVLLFKNRNPNTIDVNVAVPQPDPSQLLTTDPNRKKLKDTIELKGFIKIDPNRLHQQYTGSQESGMAGTATTQKPADHTNLLNKSVPSGQIAHLIIKKGSDQGCIFTFSDQITVGKLASCSACIQDPTLSRQHAKINWEQHHFVIHDLGSANGTYVNCQHVNSQPLRDGDQLELGDSLLIFKWTKLKD